MNMKQFGKTLMLAALPMALSAAWAADDRASASNTYLQGGGSTLASVDMYQSSDPNAPAMTKAEFD